MRGYGSAASAVVAVLVIMTVSGPTPSEAAWSDIAPALVEQLAKLWQNNELEFLGKTCYYSQRPTIYRWQLYYLGKFSCPTLSSIGGKAKTRSRSGVMRNTIEDYLTKARAAGVVTEQQANEWLQGKTG